MNFLLNTFGVFLLFTVPSEANYSVNNGERNAIKKRTHFSIKLPLLNIHLFCEFKLIRYNFPSQRF